MAAPPSRRHGPRHRVDRRCATASHVRSTSQRRRANRPNGSTVAPNGTCPRTASITKNGAPSAQGSGSTHTTRGAGTGVDRGPSAPAPRARRRARGRSPRPRLDADGPIGLGGAHDPRPMTRRRECVVRLSAAAAARGGPTSTVVTAGLLGEACGEPSGQPVVRVAWEVTGRRRRRTRVARSVEVLGGRAVKHELVGTGVEIVVQTVARRLGASPTADDEGSQSGGSARLSSISSSRGSALSAERSPSAASVGLGAVRGQVARRPSVGAGQRIAESAELEVARGARADREGGVAGRPVGRDHDRGDSSAATPGSRPAAAAASRTTPTERRTPSGVRNGCRITPSNCGRPARASSGPIAARRSGWRRDVGPLREPQLGEVARGAVVRRRSHRARAGAGCRRCRPGTRASARARRTDASARPPTVRARDGTALR